MIKIKRNCKEIERRMLESKGAQKQGGSMVCEISQPKKDRCEMVLQSPILLCENFHSYEEAPWHTSAILQARTPFSQLRNGCETSMP